MVEVVPDSNLVLTEFQASLEQNASNIFYQRVQSRNVSNQQCSFTISSPNKRSYLKVSANIEWRFTLHRTNTAAGTFVPDLATVSPYTNARDLVSLKPVLPVANAISNITTSINGSTNTISSPRRIFECISMMHVTRDEANKYYEAGYPDKMGGQMNRSFPSITWGYNETDDTMMDQYYEFNNRLLRGDNIVTSHNTQFDNGANNGDVPNDGILIVTEPLISPPFDCYSEIDKTRMADWSPWKWMGKSIPNVDRLEIDIQFTKLDASLFYYFYGKSQDANPPALNILPNGVAANLLLHWVTVPVSTNIPRTFDVPVYNIREFQDVTNGGAASANLAPRTDRSSLIQLQSVFSILITSLQRDKDQPDYLPVACCSQTNLDGVAISNARTGGAIHNWDNYGEINTITYLLGDRPNVISATFSQREIYNITMKNCKEYPYTFDDWRGRKRPEYAGGAFQSGTEAKQGIEDFLESWADYPCKGFVAVTGADLANKTSSGVFSSNSIQVVVNWRPHSGFAGSEPGNNVYQLYNHLIFGKEFMRIESDKAQFQSMSLDESTARRLTDPPLGSLGVPSMNGGVNGVGGSLRVGGALQSGGALAPLRNKGLSGIGSRLG